MFEGEVEHQLMVGRQTVIVNGVTLVLQKPCESFLNAVYDP